MKSYLLFDLDGTLTDPKVGICTCVQYALKSFGIEEPDLDKLEPFIGPPLKDSFIQFYDMSEEQAEAAIEKYRERFSETGLFENEVYMGIPQMLSDLKSVGVKLAVASSKPTVYVKRILEHFGIAKYFDAVVGSELDGTRVNKDEVVREALRQLFGEQTVDKGKVYMIGDRHFDVEGAHALGIESVGVTYGYGSMEELKAAKSEYIVRTVDELHRFLLRGVDEVRKPKGLQRIWSFMFPFLVFCLVRSVAIQLFHLLMITIGQVVKGGSFFFIHDAEGVLEGLTGNVATIGSAIGFIAGAAFVYKTAVAAIDGAWEDMKLLHLWEEPKKHYVLLAMATIGAVLGANVFLELIGMTDKSVVYQQVAADQYAAALPVGLICYGVITPIAEELLFRGIVYNKLKKIMNLGPAVLVSGALFGLYHGNDVQGIYAFVIGVLMAYMYEYFADFRIPVFMHIGANVMAYILSFTGAAVSWMVNWPVFLACLVWAVGSIYLLNRDRQVF